MSISISGFDDPDIFILASYYAPPISNGIPESPLKGKGCLTVSYGDTGSDPHAYFVREGQNVDVGTLKLFVSKTPVNFSHVAQSSPFFTKRDNAPHHQPEILPLPWDTIEILVVQRPASE